MEGIRCVGGAPDVEGVLLVRRGASACVRRAGMIESGWLWV